MQLVNGWTGRTACALQAALRMSNELFAEHLGIGVRTVATWHQKPTLRPRSEMQQLLDTALERAAPSIKARFAMLTGDSARVGSTDMAAAPRPEEVASAAERRLNADPNISAALDWLDRLAEREHGESRRDVTSRLARLDVQALRHRGIRRGGVDQRHIAHALGEYYRDRTTTHGRYGARYGDGGRGTETSVLTSAEWLDLDCPLIASSDRLALNGAPAKVDLSLDEQAAARAAQRLAETLAMGVRLIDMPLYQLLDVDVRKGAIAGTVGVARFLQYALTMDLLEGELVDAIAAGVPTPQPGSLPLRDSHLPDLGSVLDISGRLCAGGALALCAIARPASPHRGPADYMLLVQERSGHVVNAASRLAVIPKGVHQPLTDFRSDAQIGATLRREMEEELFGRDDIDNTVADQRSADPMHPTRRSEPMKWLMESPDRLRMECTGFGLNLVSGNYEFASLIVIEDDEFWSRYGGQIVANWESSNLRQYSSLDDRFLIDLVHDTTWSNEGLFAMLQGLRRLGQIGGSRTKLPTIEWEIGQ